VSKEIAIAKPGNQEAQAALERRRRAPQYNGGTIVISLGCAWAAILGQHHQVVLLIYIVLVIAFGAWRGTAMVRAALGLDSYSRDIDAQNIKVLDEVVVTAFDDLCREQGVRLSDSERREALRELWDASDDVKEAVSSYKSLDPQQEGQRGSRTLELAKIRARLDQEVALLVERQRSEARQQGLAEDDPGARVSGISSPDVVRQLELLRLAEKQEPEE
jgi:hypothetical protein